MMGAFLSRQLIMQGYYFDMVLGFVTRVGGKPVMIRYPPDLRDLPEKCPLCQKGSGLNWIYMQDNLLNKRQEYAEFCNAIIAQRRAKGESDPYRGFELCRRSKERMAKEARESTSSSSLLRYIRRNEVSPEKKGATTTAIEEIPVEEIHPVEDLSFPVDVNAMMVCRCMKKKGLPYPRWNNRNEDRRHLYKMMQRKLEGKPCYSGNGEGGKAIDNFYRKAKEVKSY